MAVLPGATLSARHESDALQRGWDWVKSTIVTRQHLYLDVELPPFEITQYRVEGTGGDPCLPYEVTEVRVPSDTSPQAMRVLAAVLDCEVVRGGDV